MENWDVFHGDRLELERGLSTSAVREALAGGALCDDDLIRPAGTTAPWTRLAVVPELRNHVAAVPPQRGGARPAADHAPAAGSAQSAKPKSDIAAPAETPRPNPELPSVRKFSAAAFERTELGTQVNESDDVAFPVIAEPEAPPKEAATDKNESAGRPTPHSARTGQTGDDREELDHDFVERPQDVEEIGDRDLAGRGLSAGVSADVSFPVIADQVQPPSSSILALPVSSSSGTLPIDGSSGFGNAGALAEIPDEEEFSLSRSSPLTVEELDLAPMVDVAFQLVLFFMVAAQTVLYKTLEIPKPTTEQAPAAVAQGRSRTLDDLKDDYILVEIDASGAMKLDREPIAADMTTLVERLRAAREATRRKAMLLSADFGTPHRSAVLAYDAANEIGLGIVIARPAAPAGPAPGLFRGQPPANSAPGPTVRTIPN